MKLSSRSRQSLLEFKSGVWVILLLFIALGAGQLWIGNHYGAGWKLVSAAASLGVWLGLRPWQFGLLSPETRRGIFILTTIQLAGWAVVTAILYWKI